MTLVTLLLLHLFLTPCFPEDSHILLAQPVRVVRFSDFHLSGTRPFFHRDVCQQGFFGHRPPFLCRLARNSRLTENLFTEFEQHYGSWHFIFRKELHRKKTGRIAELKNVPSQTRKKQSKRLKMPSRFNGWRWVTSMLSFFTIDLTPVVKGRVCSVHGSCHLLEKKWLGLLLLACKDLTIPFFAYRYAGLCHNGPACLFDSRTSLMKQIHISFALPLQALW